MTSRLSKLAVSIALCILAPSARADDDVSTARAEFMRGADLVKRVQWSEALAAFENSNRLRPHAVTTYNIAACQRNIGQYTRARETFLRALAQNDASDPKELADTLAQDIRGYVTQIESILATITITLDPPSAAVTFDGRPLAIEDDKANPPVLVAGTKAPGAGDKPPAATFVVRADPGAHVITFTRKGFSDAVINKTFVAGSKTALPIKLDTLPATLHIASQPAGAIVTVADADVGLTPVDVVRPAGTYRVVVKKSGYIPFDSQVATHAGEDVNLGPTLPIEKKSITQRWWFWTGIGFLVTGAVVGTALGVTAAQPATRPPPNGGGLGWTVPIPMN